MPAVVAVLAGIVAVVGGIVALIPKGSERDPFSDVLYSEPFLVVGSENSAQIQERFSWWLDPDDDSSDDVWRTEVDRRRGVFRLSNEEDPTAARYVWISPKNEAFGLSTTKTDWPMAVDVRIPRSSGSAAAAGLVYRLSEQPKRYYAFVLHVDGTYSFLEREPDGGLTNWVSESSDHIRRNAWNTLGMFGDGDRIHLFINRSMVKTVRATTLRGGATGVFAYGVGTFEFDNFLIYAEK